MHLPKHKGLRYGGALLLACLLLVSCGAAFAMPVDQPLTITVSWKDMQGVPQTATAVQLPYAGYENTYWVQVSNTAPFYSLSLMVADPLMRYNFSAYDNMLINVIDAGDNLTFAVPMEIVGITAEDMPGSVVRLYVSTYPLPQEPKPQVSPVDVIVQYVDELGNTLKNDLFTCLEGNTPIYANPDGLSSEYELISTNPVTVWVDASGASRDVVVFTYRQNKPQVQPVSVAVRYLDKDSGQSVASTHTMACNEGYTTIFAAPQDLVVGYQLFSNGSVNVYVDANGANTSEAIFYYQYIQPAPSPFLYMPTSVPDDVIIDLWGLINKNSVDLHDSPNASGSNRIDQLAQNKKVWVYSAKTVNNVRWYFICTNGIDGYVNAEYVTLMEDTESEVYQNLLKTPMPTRAPVASSCIIFHHENELQSFGYINADKVNMRASTSTSSSRLKVVNRNDLVIILGTEEASDGTWYKINHMDTEGYVKDTYVTLLTVEELSQFPENEEHLFAPSPSPAPTPKPLPSPTEQFKEGGYTYTVNADGTATITKYAGSATKLVVPGNLGGYPVAKIGDRAFSGLEKLLTIELPDSLESIGESAFSLCRNMTNLTIPGNVIFIGNEAFAFCYGLSIHVAADQPIFSVIDGVLFRKTDKALIFYPTSLTQTSYTVPQGIKRIEESAFYVCEKLNRIVLPDSVTSIGSNAFRGCTGLERITLSPNITIIDTQAFWGCENLKEIVLPENLTTIGDWAFYHCKSLTSIRIPDRVITIGTLAFSACYNIVEFVVPEHVSYIGGGAFTACKTITVSPGNQVFEVIDGVLFNKKTKCLICCPRLLYKKSYDIPQGTQELAEYAFYYCSYLSNLTIPEGVTVIGKSVFTGCEKLTKLVIPEGVEMLPGDLFTYCGNLTVTIPDSVVKMDYVLQWGGVQLTFIVGKGSCAEKTAKDQKIPYQYHGYDDWLND